MSATAGHGRVRRRGAFAASAAGGFWGLMVAAVALSGCTGTGDREPSPSVAVTAEESGATPTTTPVEKPEKPAAMRRDDAKGAAAAAEYFIELYPYVMATGDTEEFEAMSHEACGFCADVLAAAQENAESDYTYIGGSISSEILTVHSKDPLTGIYPIDLKVEQAKSSTLDSAGMEIASASKEANESRVEIANDERGWMIIEIAPTPEA